MPAATNTQRVQRIVAALAAHEAAQAAEGEKIEEITEGDRAQDLLTDFMHFCDDRELDFDDLLRLADLGYRSEIDQPPPF